jgi:hypothetical protein
MASHSRPLDDSTHLVDNSLVPNRNTAIKEEQNQLQLKKKKKDSHYPVQREERVFEGFFFLNKQPVQVKCTWFLSQSECKYCGHGGRLSP